MGLSRVRFTLRQMMVAVVAIAVITSAATRELGPPEAVLRAADKELPGIKIQRVRRELFNGIPAWAVRGIDGKGAIWEIDVSGSGEILMAEPIYDTVNKIHFGAVSPIEDPRRGLHVVALTQLEQYGKSGP